VSVNHPAAEFVNGKVGLLLWCISAKVGNLLLILLLTPGEFAEDAKRGQTNLLVHLNPSRVHSTGRHDRANATAGTEQAVLPSSPYGWN
jgi:hypothetical protein